MEIVTQPTDIMRQMLEPVTASFDTGKYGVETAELFANLEVTPAMAARLQVLGEKCNEGELTPAELAEYETYVQVGDLFAILKAQAKQALAQTT